MLLTEEQRGFCLTGSPGTGKTYTVQNVLTDVINKVNNRNRVDNPTYDPITVRLLGSTHKSVSILQDIYNSTSEYIHAGEPATIYSYLGLRPEHKEGNTKLVQVSKPIGGYKKEKPFLLIIDEASMLPQIVLNYLFSHLEHNPGIKVLFIYDHLQLNPPKTAGIPIHQFDIPSYELTQYMRSQDKRIESTVRYLQKVVAEKSTPSLIPEMVQKDIDKSILIECLKYARNNTVVVAYTNRAVNAWNEFALSIIDDKNRLRESHPRLIGETYEYPYKKGSHIINTDSVVYLFDGGIHYLGETIRCTLEDPNIRASTLKTLAKKAKEEKDWSEYYAYKQSTPDLRLPYARTAHKVQGDTIDYVFVDLDDIMSCRNPDTRNRLLYVACSRARKGLYLL